MKADRVIRWLDTTAFLAIAVFVFTRRPWDAWSIAGFSIAWTGFVLWMVARTQLGRSFSITAQARALVTHGLYRKIRHPVYFFGEVAYFGLVVAWRHWAGYLYIAVTWGWQVWRGMKEERVLERAFGEEYRRYKAATWF